MVCTKIAISQLVVPMIMTELACSAVLLQKHTSLHKAVVHITGPPLLTMCFASFITYVLL